MQSWVGMDQIMQLYKFGFGFDFTFLSWKIYILVLDSSPMFMSKINGLYSVSN